MYLIKKVHLNYMIQRRNFKIILIDSVSIYNTFDNLCYKLLDFSLLLYLRFNQGKNMVKIDRHK